MKKIGSFLPFSQEGGRAVNVQLDVYTSEIEEGFLGNGMSPWGSVRLKLTPYSRSILGHWTLWVELSPAQVRDLQGLLGQAQEEGKLREASHDPA